MGTPPAGNGPPPNGKGPPPNGTPPKGRELLVSTEPIQCFCRIRPADIAFIFRFVFVIDYSPAAFDIVRLVSVGRRGTVPLLFLRYPHEVAG